MLSVMGTRDPDALIDAMEKQFASHEGEREMSPKDFMLSTWLRAHEDGVVRNFRTALNRDAEADHSVDPVVINLGIRQALTDFKLVRAPERWLLDPIFDVAPRRSESNEGGQPVTVRTSRAAAGPHPGRRPRNEGVESSDRQSVSSSSEPVPKTTTGSPVSAGANLPVWALTGMTAGTSLLTLALALVMTGSLGLLESSYLSVAGMALLVPAILFIRDFGRRHLVEG